MTRVSSDKHTDVFLALGKTLWELRRHRHRHKEIGFKKALGDEIEQPPQYSTSAIGAQDSAGWGDGFGKAL